MKAQIYGFHPAVLKKKELNDKSNQLDRFWAIAKSSPQGAACLRQMLKEEETDGFFLFDGAQLLSSLDPSGGSEEFLNKALLTVDLRDIQPAEFVRGALRLAHKGYDTGPVAHRYLEAKEVTTYLPEHGGYKLDRLAGSVLLYGSMDPVLADKYLAEEVHSPNADARNAAAIIWTLTLTESSLKGLAALDLSQFSPEARKSVAVVRYWRPVQVPKHPKYSREQMLQKLASDRIEATDEADSKALDESAYATLTVADLDAFRAARRRLVRGVSNESVENYQEMSRVLLGVINHLDAYAQFRIH